MNRIRILKKLTLLALLYALSERGWSEEMKYPPGTLVAEGISGTIVDAKSHKPVPYAVVNIAWTLQPRKGTTPSDKQPVRLGAIQTYAGQDGKFKVEGWQQREPEASRNWEIVPGRDPMVRIYAQGYQRLAIYNLKPGKGKRPYNPAHATVLKWIGQDKTQSMKKLPAGEAALAKELRLWRQDLDQEIQAMGTGRDKQHALNSQQKLLALFSDQCKSLSDGLRQKICYPPDSDVAKNMEESDQVRSKNLVYDRPDGEQQIIPIKMMPRPNNTESLAPVHSTAMPPPVPTPAGAQPGK